MNSVNRAEPARRRPARAPGSAVTTPHRGRGPARGGERLPPRRGRQGPGRLQDRRARVVYRALRTLRPAQQQRRQAGGGRDQRERRTDGANPRSRIIEEDTESNPDVAVQKVRRLFDQKRVDAVFGVECSFLRDAIMPDVEMRNKLLLYAVNYEGERFSKNALLLRHGPHPGAPPGALRLPAGALLGQPLGHDRLRLHRVPHDSTCSCARYGCRRRTSNSSWTSSCRSSRPTSRRSSNG